jgi:hypothetical protein
MNPEFVMSEMNRTLSSISKDANSIALSILEEDEKEKTKNYKFRIGPFAASLPT